MLLHGASGTGKSSLLHLIAGLMQPTSGDVRVGDRSLSTMSEPERSRLRRSSFGLIFQKLNLLSHLTSAENIALSIFDPARVSWALEQVRMTAFANERVSNLSGGEQQRIAVARVLAQAPEILLADEPTSSLDDENAAFVADALKKAAKGKTLLVVSHDDRLVSRFSDRRSLSDLTGGKR